MASNVEKSYVDDRISKVIDYAFQSFDRTDPNAEVRDYQFGSFDAGSTELNPAKKEQIRIEKKHASEKNFIVSPIVRHHRGIQAQEEEERQHKINEEINRRIEKLKEHAQAKGYEDGVEQGKKDIHAKLIKDVNSKIDAFESILTETISHHHEVIKNQKMQIFEMVRSLTKWVILRELSEDGQYLERLLERLIHEVGTKSNLHIQVNKKHFDKMPEVLSQLETRLGKLQNTRIEIGIDMDEFGINVESQNALIKGSLLDQFANLDKIFLSVGLGDQDDKDKSGN